MSRSPCACSPTDSPLFFVEELEGDDFCVVGLKQPVSLRVHLYRLQHDHAAARCDAFDAGGLRSLVSHR